MSQLFSVFRERFGCATPPEVQTEGSEEILGLHALEACWQTSLSTFEETRDAAHLQTAAEALCKALRYAHGTYSWVVAFQAAGWPRPWGQSFSCPPPSGDRARHDAILFEMLKDIGEGIDQWETLPGLDVLTLVDRILILRNRRDSPFREFGKSIDSGHWPHDDIEQ